MSDVLSRELPAPKRWQELESLAFDVFSRLWQTTDAELHGRTGQPQAGVDVYGTNRVEKLFTGVQCKGKDADYGGVLTEAELREEVAKALTFQPPLQAYIILTTAPNDVAVQKLAREITAEHAKKGLFEVRVTGWDTFRHRIADHPDLLVKYFRDFAPVDLLGLMNASTTEHRESLAVVTRMLQSTYRMVTDLRDDKAGTDELATRVTEVSKLIGDGSPKAALKRLDRILADEGETATPLARYRIFASKGNAYYVMGDEASAIKFFREACEAYPGYVNARATMAMVHFLEGDTRTAYELASTALSEDPTSVRTAGIFIDAVPEGKSLDDIISRLSPEVLGETEIKLHLAIKAHRLGDTAAHRRLAEEAYSLNPNDWRTLSAVAEALVVPLATIDGLAVTHVVPEEIRADVERATELNAKAWEMLSQRDSSFQGRHVAANLIGLLELLGRDEEAEGVLDQALQSNPTYEPLVFREARRFAYKGDWQAVAAALDRIPDGEISFDAILLCIQAAISLNDADSALAVCERLESKAALECEMPERDQLIAALRVKANIVAGADRDAAIEAAIRSNPEAIVMRSVLFDDLPDDDPLRRRMVDEIRDLAAGDLTLRERMHAAETLYAAGHFSLAADLYEPLHDRADSHALRRRLHALHMAERRADARRLFESLPPALRTAPAYLSIGINVYERAGLLKPALKLLEQALRDNDVLTNRLAWIQLLARLGRFDTFKPWLAQVAEDIAGRPEELISLARIIEQYVGDDPKALSIGYRGLRAGYNRPQVHLGYAIGLIINGRPNDASMAAPAEVAPGTGVILRNETTGDKLFRVIETAPEPVIERGELAPTDPFAARLLGLKAGDEIDIVKVGVGTQNYRVVELQSRFVFAFQRTLRDFPTLFPGHPAFGSFEIDEAKGDAKFEQMFTLARKRAEQAHEIERLYRDNVMPVPMAAKFSGASVFDLWEAFAANPKLGFRTALGVAGEFEAGRKAAAEGVALVDPLTLYGWVRLGLAPILAKSPHPLAVVQATIDTLRELVEERQSQRGREMGTFGWDGEHYQFVRLAEDAIEQQISDATAVLNFAESLMLVPAEADRALPDAIKDFLGGMDPAYQETLIAALQPKRALLTDDLGFRIIGQEARAQVTWTQAFAQAAHGANGISHPEYRTVVGALIDANHRFTQFGHADVLGELLEAGWSINNRLKGFAKLMMAAELDWLSISQVLARLLLDSRQKAPDDNALATFHILYVEACREEDRLDEAKQVYAAALTFAQELLVKSVNRILLPRRLLATTSLTSPEGLVRDSSQLAREEVERLWQAMLKGGLSLDA